MSGVPTLVLCVKVTRRATKAKVFADSICWSIVLLFIHDDASFLESINFSIALMVGGSGITTGFFRLLEFCCREWLVQVTEEYSGLSESPTKRRLFHRNIGCCQCAILLHCLKNRGWKKGLWKTVMTLICHQNELKRNGYNIHYNLGINCSFFRKPCIITMSQ